MIFLPMITVNMPITSIIALLLIPIVTIIVSLIVFMVISWLGEI